MNEEAQASSPPTPAAVQSAADGAPHSSVEVAVQTPMAAAKSEDSRDEALVWNTEGEAAAAESSDKLAEADAKTSGLTQSGETGEKGGKSEVMEEKEQESAVGEVSAASPGSSPETSSPQQSLQQPQQKKTFVLTSHNRNDFKSELVLNPALFPNISVGDYVEIFHPNTSKRVLLQQVTNLDQIRGNIQVSLLKSVTKNPAFQLETFQPVVVRKCDPSKYALSYVEISFKDQYISQGEFWRFRDAMRGKSCYIGQKVSECGINAGIDEMLTKGNKAVACGVVRDSTKFIFRSCSARLFWLVQMSKEMWNFAEDGDLYFERFLNRFVTEVFEKWTQRGMTHRLTVVYFTRTYYNIRPPPGTPAVQIDSDGRFYTDLYHTVVENETRPDWASLKVLMKREFHAFPRISGWEIPTEFYDGAFPLQSQFTSSSMDGNVDSNSSTNSVHSMNDLNLSSHSLSGGFPPSPTRFQREESFDSSQTNPDPFVNCHGLPSTAQEGNCLEAINLCLNILDKHYMDRDLIRTGQAMVLVTAGTGVFEVDRELTNITKQRMMDNAIGCDFISLTRAPLHVAPLFVYKTSRNRIDVLDRPHPFANPALYKVFQPEANTIDDDGAPGNAHKLNNSGNQTATINNKTGNGQTSFPISCSLDAYRVPYLGGQGTVLAATDQDRDREATFETDAPQMALPVFNIPHWIHLSFPYHKSAPRPGFAADSATQSSSNAYQNTFAALYQNNDTHTASNNWNIWKAQLRSAGTHSLGEQFEPLPFNRMYDLTEPSRSSLPVALISQLFWSAMESEKGADFKMPYLHRLPPRAIMNPWYPLMRNLTGQHPMSDTTLLPGQDLNTPSRDLAFDDAKEDSPSLNAMLPGFYAARQLALKRINLPNTDPDDAQDKGDANHDSLPEVTRLPSFESVSSAASAVSVQTFPSQSALEAETHKTKHTTVRKQLKGASLYEIRKTSSFDILRMDGPTVRHQQRQEQPVGVTSPDVNKKNARDLKRYAIPTADTLTKSQSAIFNAQQMHAYGIGGIWSDRLSEEMEKHAEFDRNVFRKPHVVPKASFSEIRRGPASRNSSTANLRTSKSTLSFSYRSIETDTRDEGKERSPSMLSISSGESSHIHSRPVSPSKARKQSQGRSLRSANEKSNNLDSFQGGKILSLLNSSTLSTPGADSVPSNSVVEESSTAQPLALLPDSSGLEMTDDSKSSTKSSTSLLSRSFEQGKSILSWDNRGAFGPGRKVSRDMVSTSMSTSSVVSSPGNDAAVETIFEPVYVPQASDVEQFKQPSGISSIGGRLHKQTDAEVNLNPKKGEEEGRTSQLQGQKSQLRQIQKNPLVLTRQTSTATNLSSSATSSSYSIVPHINPFDWSVFTSQLYQQRLTHNRRRWSHLFPTGRFDDEGHGVRVEDFDTNVLEEDGIHLETEDESSDDEDEVVPLTIESFRLNWKSLKSPGILPLTTDYFPDRADLACNYRENFYSLTLPEAPGDYGYSDHEDLIHEMVCQRLSQDFQLLVETRSGKRVESHGNLSNEDRPRSPANRSSTRHGSTNNLTGTNSTSMKQNEEGAVQQESPTLELTKERSANAVSSPVLKPSAIKSGSPFAPPSLSLFGGDSSRAMKPTRGGSAVPSEKAVERVPWWQSKSGPQNRSSHPGTKSSNNNTITIRPAGTSSRNKGSGSTASSTISLIGPQSKRVVRISPVSQPPRPKSQIHLPQLETVQEQSAESEGQVGETETLGSSQQKEENESNLEKPSEEGEEIDEEDVVDDEEEEEDVPRVARRKQGEMETNYVLTMGHQIHQLEYNPETREVKVKISVHHNFSVGTEKQWPYQYLLYDRTEKITAPVHLQFTNRVPFYAWNRLDYLVCGYMDNFAAIERYRRNMFLILPASRPGERKKELRPHGRPYASSSDNVFVTGRPWGPQSSGTPTKSADLSSFHSSHTDKVRSPSTSSLATVGSLPIPLVGGHIPGTSPATGGNLLSGVVPPQGRQMRRFGSAALSSNRPIAEFGKPFDGDQPQSVTESSLASDEDDEDIDVFQDAYESSLEDWAIDRINADEEDKNIKGFQRFLEWVEAKVSKRLQVTIRRRFVPSKRSHTDEQLAMPQAPAKSETDISTEVNGARSVEPEEMSIVEDNSVLEGIHCKMRSVKVEIQSRSTGRYEWLVLQYDTIYTPYQGYHMEVQWMVAAGASVQNFVSALSRKAKQAGLNFQQIPEYCRSTAMGYVNRRVPHPFVLPKDISFTVDMKNDQCFRNLLAETLQAKADWVLDSIFIQNKTGDTKWHTLVHKEGYGFLHFSPLGVEFLQNRLVATPTLAPHIYETGLQVFRDTKYISTSLNIAYSLVSEIVDHLPIT